MKRKRLVSDVLPDPKNARSISDEARTGLGESLEAFGDLSGLVFNQRNGLLVAGHQRWSELQAAGATVWTQVSATAGVVIHPKTGEPFPIRIVDWDDHKHRLANLTANNPAIQGEYTEAALEQVRALDKEPGFEELRLDALAELLVAAAPPTTPGNGQGDQDAPPPDAPTPRAKTGDIWVLGQHRLACGDSRDAAVVDRLMGGLIAVLMATDPPYGVDYTATKEGMPVSGLGDAQERWGDIENDDLSPAELKKFLLGFIAVAPIAPHAGVYVWHPSGELNEVFRAAMIESKMIVHRQIVWAKPGFVLTRSGMYHWAHETCFYGWRQGNVPPWYGEKNQTSVWALGRDDGKAVHPTQKPVALFEIPMANHTREGEICYEPFSGSGSQIIAGERMKRRVFAIDMSARWVDAAIARWEAFTGQIAVLEDPDLRSTHTHRGSRRRSRAAV